MDTMKWHLVNSIGKYSESRNFGIMLEKSKKRVSDPEGTFYGVLLSFYNKSLVLGICIHKKNGGEL